MTGGELLVSETYDLYESFSEAVRGWSLDFRQLSRHQGSFFLEQLMGHSLFFSRAYLPSSFHQRGASTPGCRTVSMLVSGSPAAGWRWCGETVSHNSLLVMPVSGEFESFSTPGLDTLHIAVPIAMLEDVAATQFQQPLHELMPEGRCFCPNGGPAMFQLRQTLDRILGIIRSPSAPMQAGELAAREYELACLILSCLAAGGTGTPGSRRGKRMKVLDTSLAYIAAADYDEINVAGLVRQAGVSRRTLENAFQDGLGISPASYLKAIKLNTFSRRLLEADRAEATVATVAREVGFAHLGQLAADYYEMFGERPLATLRRSSGRAQKV
ncbi:helix-turn-helix domain-containing protein [Halioglobus maricola]|uniref:Helix-turn-helix domain-containing protein n=1 Tax=Halioglobus maricola TaxID=2601894 RepID=A0A5P9NNI6_9GAMM|nr:helix-turn-helix domain-containing protein [Halioglobus maricola]QFU77367.1 helix-turn-helix domain-containing protein [Halioglobus maricola]